MGTRYRAKITRIKCPKCGRVPPDRNALAEIYGAEKTVWLCSECNTRWTAWQQQKIVGLEAELAETKEQWRKSAQDFREALEEAVKLQFHYAGLLNVYDGGTRLQFKSADEFIERLQKLKEAKREAREWRISPGEPKNAKSAGKDAEGD